MSIDKEMDWKKLVSKKRSQPVKSVSDKNRNDFHRDYDRIVFSAAFRRLGRKTQVHPLSLNDNIHTRLTHSLETGSVARGLGVVIGEWLMSEKLLPDGIDSHDIGAIVQAASVAHDIGNPPFGHAGEYAIRHWYENNNGKLGKLDKQELNDLKMFEGNAQGFRILTQLENYSFKGGLRLSYATLASTIKYPWTSIHKKAKEKFNIYKEEEEIFKEIAKETGLIELSCGHYSRHPLSYLMEAADDICYRIVDIEDALTLKLIRLDDVEKSLFNMGGKNRSRSITKERKRIISLRTIAINNLVEKCVQVFKDNYSYIMKGKFEGDLISQLDGIEKKGLEIVRKITTEKIFTDRRKIELEIGSHSSLDIIMKSLIKAVKEFQDDSVKKTFKSEQLFKLLDVKPEEGNSYYQCYMKINDYVSGMTDNYATFIAGQISGQAK
jgi:dGTPase